VPTPTTTTPTTTTPTTPTVVVNDLLHHAMHLLTADLLRMQAKTV
jgi:hypothetical protein